MTDDEQRFRQRRISNWHDTDKQSGFYRTTLLLKKVLTSSTVMNMPVKRTTLRTELLRFNGAVKHDPAIDAWMKEHAGELGAIAEQWFEEMRKCGDEVRELLHDGCPTACLGDAPFGYVNVFTSHVNVGFFHGAALPDPARLLQGTGKSMRHVKLKPELSSNAAALNTLIETAYVDIKERVENG